MDPDALREPTREELYNGPSREALAEAVQAMGRAETVCRYSSRQFDALRAARPPLPSPASAA